MVPAALLTAPAAVLVAGTAVLVAGTVSSAEAQEWKEFRSARHPGDLQSVSIEVVYGAGRLAVGPSEVGRLYDLRVQYDASRFAPTRTWNAADGEGRLRVSLASRGEDQDRRAVRREDVRMDLTSLRRLGDAGTRLELDLGRDVPVDLQVTVGAAESTLRLGGIPLTRLSVETGASDTRVSFDEPNPVRMGELDLRAGAAAFRAEGLGNANFQQFRFRGGVGDVTLDFTGRWTDDARASISVGVGSLRLRLPRELGVRIRKSSFLTSFDAREFIETDDGWQTENWSRASAHLEVDLDAAFGSITVERVP